MRSVIRTKKRGNDEMCSARAIATGIARIKNDPNYKSIRQSYGKQADYARALHKEVGVPFGKCGVEEIKRFGNTRRMQTYKIMVISKETSMPSSMLGLKIGSTTIYLYSHDLALHSVRFITNRTLAKIKGYDAKSNHKCENACNLS